MELRPYQKAAVEAVYTHLRTKDTNPCVVIPTGGGKTPVLATIVSDAIQKWDGRVMIVSHVKELLEQAADKIKTVYQDADVGIFSSGLKSWETDHKCIVAGIQSVLCLDVARNACAQIKLKLSIANVLNNAGNNISCI